MSTRRNNASMKAQAFVVVGPQSWGKAATLSQARKQCVQSMPAALRKLDGGVFLVYAFSCAANEVEVVAMAEGAHISWPPSASVLKFEEQQ